jgi:hypothetical protein
VLLTARNLVQKNTLFNCTKLIALPVMVYYHPCNLNTSRGKSMDSDIEYLIIDGSWQSEDTTEYKLPKKWVVCPTCKGEGTCGNPAFNGMTADEIHPDDRDEFYKNYFSGVYDVNCPKCDGRTTVQDYDISRLETKHREELEQQLSKMKMLEAEEQSWARAEQRMGC